MAGARSLGSLTLDLIAKTGQFTAGMTAAERQASKSFSAIEKRAKAFGTALGVGLVAAAGALTALTKSAIDNADALRDSSIQLGISTETLSAYGYAAQQTGTDLDGLSRGLKILSKNAADALKPTSEQAKIFDALGISVTDAAGNLRELDQLVPDIADAFAQLEDGTQKAALAQALFGKSGLELTEFLNSGARGLQDFTDKARELGIIVGTDTANAADEFNDKLSDLKALVSGFGNQLAAELLPRLIELVDYFNQAAKEGSTLGTSVKDLGSIFDVFIGEIKKADEVGESFRLMLAATSNTVSSLKDGLSELVSLNISGFIQKMNDARNAATSALLAGFGFGGKADFSGVSSRVIGATSTNARGGSNRPETGGINRSALADALAGITEPKGKKAKSAKKEVDELDEAYKRLLASMKEEVALFGQTTEVAKIRYDLENGELAKLSQAKKDELLGLAQQIDSMKEIVELEEAAQKAAEKESERIKDALADNESLIEAMQFEYELLGMTNKERERELALRQLNLDATDEQKQKVAELADAYTEMQETISVMDDIRSEFGDFFSEVLNGTKSVKDAFKDMLDDIQKRILDRIAQNWVDQLFGQMGSSGGGASASGGTDWLALIGSLFGGGKASGGSVGAGKFYRINENGPEMLSVSGKDYLMMGPNSGSITPNDKLLGRSLNVTQVFNNPIMADRRSDGQRQLQAGRELRVATRNS